MVIEGKKKGLSPADKIIALARRENAMRVRAAVDPKENKKISEK